MLFCSKSVIWFRCFKMKYNFGCGFNKFDGFVNIDKFEHCEPDLLMDIETLP